MKAVVYTEYGPPDVLEPKVAEALRYFGEGHAKGKVVITVQGEV